jgi:thiol-disulfide isomerase/thioredoxin
MMMVSIGIGIALAVALIAVVSVLTGAKVSDNHVVLPKTELVGKHVQDFTLDGLGGGTEGAPWTHGRASVLVFFASWCVPCRGEIPRVATWVRTHDTGPVEVLGIDANDERAAAQAFVRKDGVTFPVAFDADGTVTSSVFGFAQLPETVFISAKGVVTGVHFGAISNAELARGVKALRSA